MSASSPKNDPRDTPAMRQYAAFKKQHPDCVLFFRMGDFYEMFDADALLAHKTLGVTLTQRTAGIPMAGVPFHAVENYLRRMIAAGHRVAVCEQMEDAALAKGLVDRQVTRIVTPGTLTDAALLDEASQNPLAAVMFLAPDTPPTGTAAPAPPNGMDQTPAPGAAVAWVELSTGAFHVALFPLDSLADELARIGPRELLYVETANRQPPPRVERLAAALGCPATPRPVWPWRGDEAAQILRKQFAVASLAGFGFPPEDPALSPAGAIVHYLLETQCAAGAIKALDPQTAAAAARPLAHLQPPRRFERSEFLVIDQTSLRSLEIEKTMRDGSVQGSLLATLQDGRTPMGKRLLRQWLCFPQRDGSIIRSRQNVVGALVEDSRFLESIRSVLEGIQDVERILGRVGIGRASPRDVVALGQSCSCIRPLLECLADRPSLLDHARRLEPSTGDLTHLADVIARACTDNPPAHLREGGLFQDGYDPTLDEYRALQRDGSLWLAAYQQRLAEETGIANLKVGFNRVFGFYIELSAAQKDKAPAGWSRKQTLKNCERFITQELKTYEDKVLSAEQRAIAREQELFTGLCAQVQARMAAVTRFAQCAAELDVLAGFARRAVRRRYVKPQVVDQPVLHITAGRHPVLDEILGDRFVPNDLQLTGATGAPSPAAEASGAGPSLALITGPNMAGKSTFIRQAALIVLLAHTGSWVPAEAATVGLTDRIFTRIGASDEIHAGQSTFMVEMTETAHICHHATPQSVVILDEIGRGTSTLDGLSLAWAIAEHLAQRGCRTLFATHYHEITALAGQWPQVGNLHVAVREWGDEIVFLHRVDPGATDRSYGIHVAKIAGLPARVVQRAHELMSQLEVNHQPAPVISTAGTQEVEAANQASLTKQKKNSRKVQPELPLFTEYLEHPILTQLRQVDINHLTPLQAFDEFRKILSQLPPKDQ